MKTILYWGLVCMLLIFPACSSDDDTIVDRIPLDDDEYVIQLSFDPEFSVIENELSREIMVYFDKPAIQQGEISLRLHIEEGLTVITEPEAINNIIKLKVKENDTRASFILKPVDDKIIRGMKILSVVFESGIGNFEKADEIGLSITMIDDELQGRLKSIINGLGDWEWENVYEYTASGKIKSIANIHSWYGSERSKDEYFYDAEDRISHVKFAELNGLEGSFKREIFYTWEEEKLKKSEFYENDVLKSYSLYEYDSENKIYQKTDFNHTQQPYSLVRYAFYDNGELQEETTFDLSNGEPSLVSSTIYTYLDKLSPVIFNSIIPGETLGTSLLQSVVYQTGAEQTHILFSYEFDEDERLIKRQANGETLKFTYY